VNNTIKWLLEGDVSVQYMVHRWLLDVDDAMLNQPEQNVPYDPRMKPALDWLQGKRRHDGLWYLENTHKGNVHFVMEELRSLSRFITVKALRILRHYADDIKSK
jgi:hypothetical protein